MSDTAPGLLSRIAGALPWAVPSETRSLTASTPGLEALAFGHGASSGVVVNSETALRYGPAFAAISILTDTIATLPVDVVASLGLARQALDPQPEWLASPSPTSNSVDLWSDAAASLVVDGNAFIAAQLDDMTGDILILEVLDPQKVSVERVGSRVRFWVTTTKGVQLVEPATRAGGLGIIHVKALRRPGSLRGFSPLAAAAESIGLGIATHRYASSVFANGAVPHGVIEFSSTLTLEQASEALAIWQASHGTGNGKANLPALLNGGAKWQPLTLSPESVQLETARRLSVEETARLFRVPVQLLGAAQQATFANYEHAMLSFLVHSVRPYLVRIEAAFREVLPEGQRLRFVTDGLLRADTTARYAAYQVAIVNGVMTQNEVRALEDLPPMKGGDVLYRPLNVGVVGTSDDPTPTDNPGAAGA